MPRPTADETEQEYVSRFMASAEARRDYPDEKQRAAVAYSMWKDRKNGSEFDLPEFADDDTVETYATRLNALANIREAVTAVGAIERIADVISRRRKNARATVAPRRYAVNFIEPGLVKYEDIENSGNLLVRKPALDEANPSIVGVPVMDTRHHTPEEDKFLEEADGVVIRSWWDPTDGQYWCEYLVWDPQSQVLNELGADTGRWSVSCAWDPLEATEAGGDWHSIPYEGEVTKLKYTHLAIVPNPRYEGARIRRLNSKGGLMFGWFKGEKKEIDPAKSVVTMADGSKQTVAAVLERLNALAAAPADLSDDVEIEVAGQKKTIGQIKTELATRKNASDDDDEKKKKEEERKNAEEEERKKKEEEERKNAEEKERKEKEESERKNAKAEADKKAREEEERKNAAHFKELEMARLNAKGVDTVIETKAEQVARGREMFGSKKIEKVA